ncbi:MAG TPA: cation:proton antiporter [Verrucomicrobiae bacterium]
MAICIVAAWLFGIVGQLLRQPLILMYLLAGVVIGKLGLGMVSSAESIKTISDLGLILLLFMIGLEIDLKKILGAGKLITFTAISQIFGGFAFSAIFFWLLRTSMDNSLSIAYLIVASVLSSTVIIVKILYDKRELDTFAGRLTLGILVLQDLVAIVLLSIQPNLDDPQLSVFALSLGKAAFLIGAAFLISRFFLPPLFRSIARLPELVLVGAIGWCFWVSWMASNLGLSAEMGALVAGVALSTFPYTLDVSAKVTSLRDFFVTLFFVALGMAIPMPTFEILRGALIFCSILFVGRFITVFIPMLKMHCGHRASLLTSINLAQVSEFSLVIVALGLQYKHITEVTAGIVSYAFVIMAIFSTYLISNAEVVIRRLSTLLSDVNIDDLNEEGSTLNLHGGHPKVFLLGFSWSASSLLDDIRRKQPDLVRDLAVIDFNPQVTEGLKKRNVRVIYGDISQRDTLLHSGVDTAEIIVCTLPNSILKGTTNQKLVRMLREINPNAKIIMHAEYFADLPALYSSGASYVSVPRLTEAAELLEIIDAAGKDLLDEKRADQEAFVKKRDEVIP